MLRYALRMNLRRRATLAVVVVVAGGSTLVSCAPVPPDPDVLAGWVRDWNDGHDGERIVAAASGLVSASTEAEESESGITATLAVPEPIANIEVSCFGKGAMRFAVQIQQGSSFIDASTPEPLDCAASPHSLPASELGIPAGPVSAITFRGFDASEDTAWGATANP